MISNIEPLAREMTEHICRRNGMSEANIPGWVDMHWQCAAAMLEAGVMDENGEWITGKDVHLGIEAYRERFARQDEIRVAASITKSRSSSFDHG